MSISFGRKVTASGLQLLLDPKNPKSYRSGSIPGQDFYYFVKNKWILNTNDILIEGTNGSQYFSFNGEDDAIIVPPDSWQNSSSWSVSCWLYPTTIVDRIYTFFGKGYNTGYRVSINPDGNISLYDRNTVTLETTTQPISIVQWKNIVVTVSPTGSQIYVNGVLEASNTIAFTGNTSESPLAVGAEDDLFSAPLGLEGRYSGRMFDFRFYSRVLEESEITRIYNSISDTYVFSIGGAAPSENAILLDGENNVLLTDENGEILLLP
jgi:hypothetical protein